MLIPLAALDAQVKLEHKFPDGRKTTVNNYVKIEQTLTISGMEIPSTSEQNITTSEANGKRQADGPVKQGDTWEREATVLFVTYSMSADSPSPLKIVDSDLKVTESNGTVLFDRIAGMTVESKDKIRVAGSLKCEVGGNELPGKLDLIFETSSNRS